METLRKTVILVAIAAGVAVVAGYETVPAQKASARVDRALDPHGVVQRAASEGATQLLVTQVDGFAR